MCCNVIEMPCAVCASVMMSGDTFSIAASLSRNTSNSLDGEGDASGDGDANAPGDGDGR